MNIKLQYTAFLCLLTIHSVFSQWVQTGGPYGTTRIVGVFTNNSRIYAATSCGLHSTGSLTDKWDLKSTLILESFVKKDNILYFGGSKSGIQRLDLSEPGFIASSDGMQGVTVLTLKDGGTCLYAGIEGMGFYKSTGYTGEWTPYNLGLPAETAYYPPEQGGGSYYIRHANSIEILDSTIFCATHVGVYKANMRKMMWSKSGAGLSTENVQFIKLVDGYLLAALDNRLYYSSDKGENWRLMLTAASKISSINGFKEYLAVTTLGAGIYVSPDHGLTWKTLNDGLTDVKVTMVTVINDTPICGTETQGIFYYNGTSWVNHSTGIICSDIKAMDISGNSLAASDPNKVYLANSSVSSWTSISPSIDNAYFGFINTMGNKIFLSYMTNDGGQFIKYSNGDNAWQDLKTQIPFKGNDPYKMRVNGNRLYVYENGIIYYTDDLGATWTNLTYSDKFCNDVYDLIVYKNTPFSASCGSGELLRLSDNMQWGL
ncbi:MAG: WD40/YVTN/BNR-like repeat-containing protein, partial [Bacteroidales bacterium]